MVAGIWLVGAARRGGVRRGRRKGRRMRWGGREERDKVYHLIERFGLRSELRAIELGGWRMEWGDFRL